MRPHADDTPASYRAALLAAFDGPIPDDCRAALERLERTGRTTGRPHPPAIRSSGLPTVRRPSSASCAASTSSSV